MKDIKDYLHLYLGCEVDFGGRILKLIGIDGSFAICEKDGTTYNPLIKVLKLVLRPLSDIKDEEYTELLPLMPTDEAIDNDYEVQMFKTTGELNRWLLSRHFDLFGLIEDGLALDKTLFSDQIKVKI